MHASIQQVSDGRWAVRLDRPSITTLAFFGSEEKTNAQDFANGWNAGYAAGQRELDDEYSRGFRDGSEPID